MFPVSIPGTPDAVVEMRGVDVVRGSHHLLRGIDWHAHLGGLGAGLLLGAVYAYAPRAHRVLYHIAAAVAVLGVVVAAVALRTAELGY